MASKELNQYAQEAWQRVRPALEGLPECLVQNVETAPEDEQTLLKLLYGTLPASDVAGVSFETLQSYVRHGLFLLETVPSLGQVPEDIFVHYVLYPRINSEEIVDCRRFFHDRLASVVAGLETREAVLAVNRWCAQQMTYASTDDRTIDPLAAYFCGSGRCGEESTFAVTALRSVGIPARQVYATWWSHCDDNHAWVEVYVDGAWHFLGACEPEPVLDLGWFNHSASRAMLICSRRFCDYTSHGVREETLCRTEGTCLLYNQIGRYARTALLRARVLDAEGNIVPSAAVGFYVLNGGSLRLIAELSADREGWVSLETGLGSIYLEASGGGCFAWMPADTRKELCYTLRLTEHLPAEGIWSWDFDAPEASWQGTPLTRSQSSERAAVLEEAKTLREERIRGYWSPAYETGDEKLDAALKSAGKNVSVLWDFCKAHPNGRDLLLSLRPKDWRDVPRPVLEAHVEAVPQEDFQPELHCPRIGWETLSAWRAPILEALTEEQRKFFGANPPAAWRWIQENFREGVYRWVTGLWLRPEAALKLGAADSVGRRTLFVAMMRTLGVPAQLNPQDGHAQYWDGKCFHSVEDLDRPHGRLTVESRDGSWSLERWEGSRWKLLEPCDGEMILGLYRLTTARRLPNGNQLAWFRVFKLEPGEMTVAPILREGSPEKMLAHYPINLTTEPEEPQLQIYLEPGTEPGQHILNELLECAWVPGLRLILFTQGKEASNHPLIVSHLKAHPETEVLPNPLDEAGMERLARSLYLEPGQLPLVCLTDGVTGYYGHCGYGVGVIPLALSLAKILGA